jgi:two-component system cell cycle response regulator
MTPEATIKPECGPPRSDSEAELVLLVEDSATQALRTRIVLEEAGWRVVVCADGADALAQAAVMAPDLVLLDLHLPGLSGQLVVSRLKSDPILASIPIIVLTSVFDQFEDVIRGLDQGADDYLLKSVRDEELVARVRASLRARRTQRELARLARLLLSVSRVGSQLAGIVDLHRLLDSACRLLHDEIPGSSVNIYLATDQELVLSSAAGPCAEAMLADPPRLPLDGESLAASCVRAGRMLQSSLPVADPRSHLGFAGVRSTLALPLPGAGKPAGVLEIASATPLVLDDVVKLVIGTIADLVGIGVSNLTLFRRMESLAMTDALTGLLNRRAILAGLEGEWSRSYRHARPLALITMDIDYFKPINDTRGHAAGDEAIRVVAETIRGLIRQEDSAGRLGGDEFLVVLPETGHSGAIALAGRIRASVAARTIADPAGGPSLALTLSLGVASWPEVEAGSSDDLLRASDQALYRAKAAGRNRAST